MPCITHKLVLVGNHYINGKQDSSTFSEGEWREEKVCKVCGVVWDYKLNKKR